MTNQRKIRFDVQLSKANLWAIVLLVGVIWIATVVAALSGYVAEQFKRHYGIADARIVMTPNGVKINEPVNIFDEPPVISP